MIFKNIIIAHSINPKAYTVFTPYGWLFSKLDRKYKHKHSKQSDFASAGMMIQGVLPEDFYIGGCEILVGALITLLPISGAGVVGIGMIGDGARRILDGVNKMGEKQAEA